MSDNEEIPYKRRKTVHYGSLEETERTRLLESSNNDENSEDEEESGNIHVSNEYMEIDTGISKEKMLLEDFEKRKKAKQMAVSTDDDVVKANLRRLEEPICFFGEDAAARRERLKKELAKHGFTSLFNQPEATQRRVEERPNETWYHEGSEALRQARIFLAEDSLKRARKRLEDTKNNFKVSDAVKNSARNEVYNRLRTVSSSYSQFADTRPITSCEISPNGEMLVTSSFSGYCKLWSISDLEHIRTYNGHSNTSVGCMVFRPQATVSIPDTVCCMASCAMDGTVKLWNLTDDQPIGELSGHSARVSKVAFHPTGKYLASCVHDNSWRLWDVETKVELLHQEGHSKSVNDISFQCDGSLAATGGGDCYGRLWDLRTGRCIMFMQGHQKSVTSICFSPNGYQLATGSADNTVKLWDIRHQTCEYTIPAHTNIISKVLFEKNNGQFLITSSFDSTVKLWRHPGWTSIQSLCGDNHKVMSCDISMDGKTIVSCSYDKKFTLWAPEI